MNGVEAELKEIKSTIQELKEKLDLLLNEREARALMSLSEKSLSEFLSKEPELYTPSDIKVRYK